MRVEGILIPLDVRDWSIEVFSVANALTKPAGASVTLLHVVTLNIAASENRIYERLAQEAHGHLERLAWDCLLPGIPASTCVRFGKPADEILAEAAESDANLIVLASRPPSLLRRLSCRFVPLVVERVVREARCGVFLTSATKRFDCERIWGRPENDIGAALGPLPEASNIESLASPLSEPAFATARRRHRAAA
jgi:nucleotide-binding universal stress UspA family protein